MVKKCEKGENLNVSLVDQFTCLHSDTFSKSANIRNRLNDSTQDQMCELDIRQAERLSQKEDSEHEPICWPTGQ